METATVKRTSSFTENEERPQPWTWWPAAESEQDASASASDDDPEVTAAFAKKEGKKKKKEGESRSKKKEKVYAKRLPKGLACLRHRHMHKRCPPECPERRAQERASSPNDSPSYTPPGSPKVEPRIHSVRTKRAKSIDRMSPTSSSEHDEDSDYNEEFTSLRQSGGRQARPEPQPQQQQQQPQPDMSSSPRKRKLLESMFAKSASRQTQALPNGTDRVLPTALENKLEHAASVTVPWAGLGFDGLSWENVSTDEVFNDLISSFHWEESKKSQMDVEDSIFSGGDNENESSSYDRDMSRDHDSSPTQLEAREFSDSDVNNNSTGDFDYHQRELLSKILIPRDMMARCLASPHFNRVMAGFYVRICVADNVHRLALVLEVVDHYYTKYAIDNKAITDKGLLLLIGNTSKVFSIVDVSDSAPTRQEVAQWQHDMNQSGSSLNEAQVREKCEIMNAIRSFVGSRTNYNINANTMNQAKPATWQQPQPKRPVPAAAPAEDYAPAVLSHSISLPLLTPSTFDASHFGDIYTSNW